MKGPIGRLLRRHRQDDVTLLLSTMLQACVSKRVDEMLWDTMAIGLREELPRMTAADVGIALACIVKSGTSRDTTLVVELLRRLSAIAKASGSSKPPGASAGKGSSQQQLMPEGLDPAVR